MVFSLHILNTGRLRILLDQDGIVLRLEREITNKLFIFNVLNKYALQPCTDTPLAWRGPWVCGDTDELRAVGIFAAAVDTRTLLLCFRYMIGVQERHDALLYAPGLSISWRGGGNDPRQELLTIARMNHHSEILACTWRGNKHACLFAYPLRGLCERENLPMRELNQVIQQVADPGISRMFSL